MFGLVEEIDRRALAKAIKDGEAAHERVCILKRDLAPPHGIIGSAQVSMLAVSGNETAQQIKELESIAFEGLRAQRVLIDNPTETIAERERELKATIREAQDTEARARAELDRLAMQKLEAE